MKLLNNKIDEIVSEVIEILKTDERLLTYHMLKEIIEKDEVLNHLWEKQKTIQQELVHAKAYKLLEQQQNLEIMLQNVENQLATHPLMLSYQEAYMQVTEIQNEIEEIVFSE